MAASSVSEYDMQKYNELSHLVVEQLCEMLKKRGLPMTGKKMVLLERLVNALNADQELMPTMLSCQNCTMLPVSLKSRRNFSKQLTRI